MSGAEVLPLFTQFGPGVAIFVLLVLLLVKLRDRVGSRVDESVVQWVDRLEVELNEAKTEARRELDEVKATHRRELDEVRQELRQERDAARRYRLARERSDAEHRRWDSDLLRTALSGGDVATFRDPPPLTPHPSTYELELESEEPNHDHAPA